MNLLIMGAPGSGKGTMSEKIIEEYGLLHISTGDLLRQAVKDKTPTGLKAQEYMSKGRLVPDEIIHDLISQRLSQDDAKKGFLMDGYPRTLAQAKDLDNICHRLSITIDMIIQLDLDEEVIARRITGRRVCRNCGAIYHIETRPSKAADICDECGGPLYTRSDDTLESLKVRLAEYEDSTKPLLGHYNGKVSIERIDGDGTIDSVFASIKEVLDGIK